MFEDSASVRQHPRTLLLPKQSAQPAKKLPESLPISSFFSRFLDQPRSTRHKRPRSLEPEARYQPET
jgi:hypothetical protein